MRANVFLEMSRSRWARSAFLVGALALAGCNGPNYYGPGYGMGFGQGSVVYEAVVDGGIYIPAIYTGTPDGLDPRFIRAEVETPAHIPNRPGTIVVDTPNRYLYLVQPNGKSMRYGIGVGREGFAWSGEAVIKAKREWPTWTPPAEMLARDPIARQYAKGMPGGLENPLGARALYLFDGDKDTLYRLHGTTDAWTIGQAVSSGCVRMLDQDVIDLYRRVPIGTHVIVLPDTSLMKPTAPIQVGPDAGAVAASAKPAAAPAAAGGAAPAATAPAPAAVAPDAPLFPDAGAPVPPAPVGNPA